MSLHIGPAPDFEKLFGQFSAEELRMFKPILEAQNAENTIAAGELAGKLDRAQKDRYNQYLDVWELYNQYLASLASQEAHHSAQIASAQQNVAYHEQAASQKMAAYAPGYKAQVDASMQKGGAATNGNGARHAAQPEKVKKKGSCTIL